MTKFFNTAGLCMPENHYMVDPLKRVTEIEKLIAKKLYFTIHAPRQTGKTTYLYALARRLNKEGKYIALVVSFESAGYRSITVNEANFTLKESIYFAAFDQLSESERPPKIDTSERSLKNYISSWSRQQNKPIILLIDEIDALLDDILIAVLRQLRDGYQARPQSFPSSIALVGLRDVREYRAMIHPDTRSLGTASPFNIKAESIFLSNFSKAEVFKLLSQHSKETGQVFSDVVSEEIFRLSAGQPWLVNAIANQIVVKLLKEDYTKPITQETVNEAKNQLIQRRDTHLDSLIDKLRDDRIKYIVQAIIRGDMIQQNVMDDDLLYIRDLGIVTQTNPLKFANPIYAEIIPRVMSSPIDASLPEEIHTGSFLNRDGSLNIRKVLIEFQEFYRENSDAWLDRFEYKESAQHLLLMAFLQRIINSGGEIVREMALGNKRIDFLVTYKKQRFAMELKIKRGASTIEKAKKQLKQYLDRLGENYGYLILFESADISWDEKIYMKEISYEGKTILMVGC